MHKEVCNSFNCRNLLTANQSGFISTISLFLHHALCKATDSGKEIRAVLCDINQVNLKRVCLRSLITKLAPFGISGKLLVDEWFSTYLSVRGQHVLWNSCTSDWPFAKAGVPQGSILEPLLLYIPT